MDIAANETFLGVLSRDQVIAHINGSKSGLYVLLNDDPSFPRPFKLGNSKPVWDSAELALWIAARKDAYRAEKAAETQINVEGVSVAESVRPTRRARSLANKELENI